MRRWKPSILAAAVFVVGLTSPSLKADDDQDDPPLSVTVVAGFHWIFVYNPGTRREDINVPADGLFIDDMNNLFFAGLPSPPAPCAATFAPTSNERNRVEPVAFPTPGTYLVICNVRQHFLNGMSALIEVRAREEN